MSIQSLTLPNGLRLVHRQQPGLTTAALHLMYSVGSRDEHPDKTGLAHLLEHLMFAGSEHVRDFDREMELAGAHNNAWTSPDFTSYHCTVPDVNLEVALRAESDRMSALDISAESFATQQSVVIEEFKQTVIDRPYGRLAHLVPGTAYQHLHYRWPTIGSSIENVAALRRDDAIDFYRRHYSPDNAVLAIVSPRGFDRVADAVQQWFGDIRPAHFHRTPSPDEPMDRPRALVETAGPEDLTLIVMAYRMERYGTRGYHAADMLSDILAGGRASRFQQELMSGSDMFAQVDASITGTEDIGLFMINAVLKHSGSEAERSAMNMIEEQLQRLSTTEIDARELQRMHNSYEMRERIEQLPAPKRAEAMARETMHNETPGQSLNIYRSLTAAEIKAQAQALFAPTRNTTIIYRPQ